MASLPQRFRTQPASDRMIGIAIAIAAVIATGVTLRVWQYSHDAALWIDEIAVARNVIDRPLSRLLFEPLAYGQTAPKGFLAVEKLAIALAGPSERAFKAWPFVASIASLGLFVFVAVRIMGARGALFAISCFACAAPLIRYAATLKQYSSDVTVCLVLMALALPREVGARSTGIVAAIAGAVSIWFSQPAVIVAAALVAMMAVQAAAWGGVRALARTAVEPRVMLWTASAAVAAVVASLNMTADTRGYLQAYWSGGFAPPPGEELRVLWPWNTFRELFAQGAPRFGDSLAYPVPALYALLSIAGLILLARRAAGWVVLAPVAATLAAAAAHQYPFRDRLILFLLPSFFIGLGLAVAELYRHLARRTHAGAALIAGLLLAGVVYPVIRRPPPYIFEDIKPVLRWLQTERTPGDGIYVYSAAAPAVDYYASQFGVPRDAYHVGGCHRDDGHRLLQDLDRFRGNSRVWIVVTHARAGDQRDMLRYLDAIGQRRNAMTVLSQLAIERRPPPAEAFLYDLSDPRRLMTASAGDFPLSGSYRSGDAVECQQGPLAMAAARSQ